jgi:hypothetical protein
VAGPAEPVACPVLDAGRRGRVKAHRLERLAINHAQEEAAPPCAATRSL